MLPAGYVCVMAIAKAALVYFAIVFGVGFALGPVRVLLLEPRLGPALAVALEVPILVLAMIVAARRVPARMGLPQTTGNLVAMGLGALVLQQLADLAVGIGLRGMTAADHLRHFATPAGAIYAASLLAFALMPLATSRLGRRGA